MKEEEGVGLMGQWCCEHLKEEPWQRHCDSSILRLPTIDIASHETSCPSYKLEDIARVKTCAMARTLGAFEVRKTSLREIFFLAVFAVLSLVSFFVVPLSLVFLLLKANCVVAVESGDALAR